MTFPPLGKGAAQVIPELRHIDAALIVVGEGRTLRRDLVRMIELLRDVPVVGTVLNRTREVADTYY